MITSPQIEELIKLRSSLNDAKARNCISQKIWGLRHPDKIAEINAKKRDGIDRNSPQYKAARLATKKENAAKRNKRYRTRNLETVREKTRIASAKWASANPEKARESWVKYRANMSPDEKKEHHKRQYQLRSQRENFRIESRLRVRCRNAIMAAGAKKSSRTLDLIGCTWRQAREWIESKFTDGMSWDNIGLWHIDHKQPCVLFDLSQPEQQKACFNFTNLQPLWARDNLIKGSKAA